MKTGRVQRLIIALLCGLVGVAYSDALYLALAGDTVVWPDSVIRVSVAGLFMLMIYTVVQLLVWIVQDKRAREDAEWLVVEQRIQHDPLYVELRRRLRNGGK